MDGRRVTFFFFFRFWDLGLGFEFFVVVIKFFIRRSSRFVVMIFNIFGMIRNLRIDRGRLRWVSGCESWVSFFCRGFCLVGRGGRRGGF